MQPPYAPSGSADGMDDGDKEYSLFSLTISIEMLCIGYSVAAVFALTNQEHTSII